MTRLLSPAAVPWWQRGAIYQVYPRSFQDSDGDGGNWIGDFGGSSWEYDAATGLYYLHAFLKEQPDLNWRNPDLRAAMLDVLRFWFDRGVEGFRIDVLWNIVKAEGLPPRIAARLGEAQARVAAVLLLTLRGTPTLYQGDELGIGEVAIPPHAIRDPRELAGTPIPGKLRPNEAIVLRIGG